MKLTFSRYFIVALVGLLADYSMLIAAKELLGFHYLVAAICGFLVGLAVNYSLSNKYVFKNPKISSSKMNFLLFGLIGLVGLGILNGLMWIGVAILGLNYLVAKTLATVVVYLWNFFARSALYRN